jgi:hypothetical protein
MDRDTMEFFPDVVRLAQARDAPEFDDVKARLDRMEARQDRQGGLLQGGGRAMARVIEWTERDGGTR